MMTSPAVDALESNSQPSFPGRFRGSGADLLAVSLLFYSGFHNYLLFHTLVELFSVLVACGIFVIAWNSRTFATNGYFMLLGIAALFIGSLDLIHTLAYQGMGVFPDADANSAAQLWIAARFVQAGSLLAAPFWLRRRLNHDRIVLFYSGVVALFVLSIFVWPIFPVCFDANSGLTPFKRASEGVICVLHILSVVFLIRARDHFNDRVLRLLVYAICTMVGAEICFMLYTDVYGVWNQTGHLLKLIAFYLFYRAIIETSFREPYHLLLRELKKSEETLERANARLRVADQRKNEFLAMLAHELRNPLGAIANGLHLLTHNQPPGDATAPIREALNRQLTHLSRLVDDLLDVSSLARGKIELRKEILDLREAVHGAVEISRPIIDAKRHKLDVILPKEPILVDADPVRLEQIISNLLINAAKYTDPGGSIDLSVEPGTEDVAIRIRDTGRGIEPAMLPVIFDLFMQADPPAEPARMGLGIGLALVKDLTLMHGGDVFASSDGPGCGSTFEVRLPRVAAEAVQAAVMSVGTQGAADGAGERGVDNPKPRVLVVDDNRDTTTLLAELLGLWGYEVRVAYDGASAIEVAARFHPHAALLDLELPIVTGYEVARVLREKSSTPLLLVAMTGYGQEEDRRRSLASGFHQYLVKPIQPETLRGSLREWLKEGEVN